MLVSVDWRRELSYCRVCRYETDLLVGPSQLFLRLSRSSFLGVGLRASFCRTGFPRVAVLVWPILLFLLLVSYLWVFAFTLHAPGDEGLILHPAERILRGQIPYRDFFIELAPGVFYIQALWFKVGGLSVESARIPAVLFLAAIGLQLYLLGRKMMPAWAASAAVMIYCIAAFSRWLVVSHHWYSLFFALAALLWVIRYLDNRERRWLILAGLATAACCLVMQNKGALLALALAAVLFFCERGRRLHAVGAYMAAIAAGVVLPLGYLVWKGAGEEMAYATFLYLWQSYLPYDYHPLPYNPFNILEAVRGASAQISATAMGKLVSTLGWSLLVPAFAAAGAIRAHREADGQGRRIHLPVPLQTVYLVVGAALLLSEMHRFDYIHILFGTPLLLIAAVAFLYESVRGRKPRSAPATAMLAIVVLIYIGQGVSQVSRELRRDAPIPTRRGTLYQTPERARQFKFVIDEIERRAPQGSEVFIYPYASLYYFLTGTSNPTRFEYLLPGQTTPEQFGEVLEKLACETAPPLIFCFWHASRASLPILFPTVSLEQLENHPIERFLRSGEGAYRRVFEDPLLAVFSTVGEALPDR